ncbi:MAG: hypothetical protein K2Y32_21700 [Candidatus Obscuribacterales bacterium]|nr:hypothetical protein [Candidatus Obscuribacterales bacterium]
MLAKGQGAKTTGAIAVLEGLSRLQDQELAKRFNIEPAPRAVAQEYLSLYPNRVQGILRPPGIKAWTTVSKHWPIPDETILSAVAGEEKNLYGLRWGDQTSFAVFDIDNGSKYHQAAELQKLQAELAAVGLTATLYQSSESGGWHIYIFLDEWTDSSDLRETLQKWLYGLGYEIRNGTLEIFPSKMGLRLPLQRGFAWLDDSGNVTQRREELSKDEALAAFINDLQENKRNWSEAKNRIESQLKAKQVSQGASPQAHAEAISPEGFDGLWTYKLLPEKYQDGRQYWQEGLSETGQRHDAILAVEHYLWHGDNLAGAAGVPALPGEWNDEPRYRLILAWLREKHNGFCNHINRGNWHKVEAQIRRAVKWRRPSGAFQVRIPYMLTENSIERLMALSKSTGRTWTSDDLKKGNDGREARAREKIRVALELLIKQERRVSCRQLMRLTACSYHTVKRHLDIWKISPVVALPRAAGEQNPFLDHIGTLDSAPGVGGSCPGSEKNFLTPVLVGDSGQTDLPGRLAPIPAPEIFIASEESDPAAELEQAAPLCSADAPPCPPLASARMRLVANSAWCLTPFAFLESGDGERLTASELTITRSPSTPLSLATGSSTGLEGLGNACGINGVPPTLRAGPSHLILGGIFLLGLGASQHRQVGSSSSGLEHADGFVCYTSAIAGGIKERAGEASIVVALASFEAKCKKKKTASDTTNSKFLTTSKQGYSSRLLDEFSLIEKPSSGVALVDVRDRCWLGKCFEISLHQPTARAPEITSACLQCCVRVFMVSIVTQAPKNEACGGCRQLPDRHLGILLGLDVRGPPKCRQVQQANLGN